MHIRSFPTSTLCRRRKLKHTFREISTCNQSIHPFRMVVLKRNSATVMRGWRHFYNARYVTISIYNAITNHVMHGQQTAKRLRRGVQKKLFLTSHLTNVHVIISECTTRDFRPNGRVFSRRRRWAYWNRSSRRTVSRPFFAFVAAIANWHQSSAIIHVSNYVINIRSYIANGLFMSSSVLSPNTYNDAESRP